MHCKFANAWRRPINQARCCGSRLRRFSAGAYQHARTARADAHREPARVLLTPGRSARPARPVEHARQGHSGAHRGARALRTPSRSRSASPARGARAGGAAAVLPVEPSRASDARPLGSASPAPWSARPLREGTRRTRPQGDERAREALAGSLVGCPPRRSCPFAPTLYLGPWRIDGLEAMWRVRAGAEMPRRAADGGRPSREPSGWRSRAVPRSTRRPWPPSHEVRGRGLALLALAT